MRQWTLLIPTLILISAAIAARGQVESRSSQDLPDERISRLLVAAETVCSEEPNKVDIVKLADVTHPRALKASGGREHFTRVMRDALESSRKQFQSLKCRLGKPKIYDLQGTLIGVIPQTLEGVTITKNSMLSNGAVIGISEDNGKTWAFINGKGFPKQFPEFADAVVIPKERMLINGVEQ